MQVHTPDSLRIAGDFQGWEDEKGAAAGDGGGGLKEEEEVQHLPSDGYTE